MNNKITKKQYQSLKETGLNFEEIARKYLTEAEIGAIPFQEVLYLNPEEGGSFANFSSFAYWLDRNKNSVYEESVANLEVLQDWDKLEAENATLRSGFVLLGVNAGAKGLEVKKTGGNETFDHFEMFQIRSIRTGNSYRGIPSAIKYKNSLTKKYEENKKIDEEIIKYKADKVFYDEFINGTYITDFVKGLPTNFGPDIKELFKEAKEKLNYDNLQAEKLYENFCKAFGEILKNELDLLGGKTHTLVVMAKNPINNIVNEFLEKSGLDKEYRIANISHYSGSPTHEQLREELRAAFSYK